jgi:hypothetical protein
VITLDGAGWHQPGGMLKVLPCPELNPQENVWRYFRQTYLFNRVFDTSDMIVDACCGAWNSLAAQPDRVTSIATRE